MSGFNSIWVQWHRGPISQALYVDSEAVVFSGIFITLSCEMMFNLEVKDNPLASIMKKLKINVTHGLCKSLDVMNSQRV